MSPLAGELDRPQVERVPLRIVDREARIVVRDDPPQAPGDGTEQRAGLEVRDERVVHLEQQLQPIAFPRQRLLGVLRGLVMEGVVDCERNLAGELPEELDLDRPERIQITAGEADPTETAQRRRERQRAVRPHALAAQEVEDRRKACLVVDVRDDERLLRLPRDAGWRFRHRQRDLGHERGMACGDHVQAHEIRDRVVQHDRHAVEASDPAQHIDEAAQQAPQVAARRGRARDVQQCLSEIRGNCRGCTASIACGLLWRLPVPLRRVHSLPF
jgi:hypothetical protein